MCIQTVLLIQVKFEELVMGIAPKVLVPTDTNELVLFHRWLYTTVVIGSIVGT
jgi:hypothetical protein